MDNADVIMVGGGPAGLNAAIVLGRCQRRVLVFDSKNYRNRYSHGMHNYLTRDGMLPSDFINSCHEELKKYGVKLLYKKIVKAQKAEDDLFLAHDEDGNEYRSSKLLIATGLQDNVPTIKGFKEFYGKSVYHCPYCDGWENRGKRIGVYAKNKEGWELALSLKAWSDDVTLYTDGGNSLKPAQAKWLESNQIKMVRKPWKELEGEGDSIKNILFEDGTRIPCDALFFVNGFTQQCDLVKTFGCELSKKGVVLTNKFQQTKIKGLYVAGDADKDMHFVVVAAAEGAKAGVIINKELQQKISERKFNQTQAYSTAL